MIISDIHGSYEWTKKACDQFTASGANHLFILGDVLYHGPRNALPQGHSPQQTSEILNTFADKIIAVRGNCEAEVDQLLLSFPCMSDYTIVVDEGREIFLTHGHLFENGLPFKLPDGSIHFSGHTHVWKLEKKDNIIFCNPGSISLPKSQDHLHTFAMYENKTLSIINLDDPEQVLKTLLCD
ncbi:MAG: phosphodiesterase [Termitinemataceae bacterium]|nr:MAG: phosphodiesterase [Termitinemataceae bacterium]